MRRPMLALSVVATSAVAALTAIGPVAHAAPRAGTAGDAGAVGFGTPVVVDNYRPGYEPDLAIDRSASRTDAYEGSTFVSVPNGFSTTQSFIWRSDDDRQSFHLAEGNALGKTDTCVGGGDSEIKVDPLNGTVYFVDLQGLTNFSNSSSTDGGHTFTTTCAGVNGTAVDRQWEGIDDNGGTAAVGPGATGGRIYLDYDNVDQGPGNELVMNASVDGVHFGAECEGVTVGTAPVGACPLPPAQISPNESIPGNVVVDDIPGSAHEHRVYAIHTGDGGSSVVMSSCSGKAGDSTAAEVSADCTDPTAFVPSTTNPTNRTNKYWHDSYVRVPGSYSTGSLFPSVAIDPAGNLYAVWSEYPTTGAANSRPGLIKMAVSTDGAATWSAPVTISQTSNNEAVMPWVTTGDTGRIGITWYGTDDTADGAVGPDASVNAEWNLFYASTVDALAAAPAFSTTEVNEPGHPVKFGTISTGGLGGAEDRSLGDFFQVQTGPQGQAVISYVDDTSDNRNTDFSGGTGETPAEAAGPVMVATQNAGPGLYAADTVPSAGTNLGAATVSDAQAAKDAFYSSAGTDTYAAADQQVVGTSVTQADSTHLKVTLTTADENLASDLGVSSTLGGPTADWLVRWAAPGYTAPGDGNIFYVGMESTLGAAPTFYTGTSQAITTTRAKYFVYPQTTTIPGVISGPTITWTVPLADVGSPATGQGLYSVTGFTSTQLTPSPTTTTPTGTGGQVGDVNIPNLIGVAPPFDYYVTSLGTPLPEVVLPVALLVVGTAVAAVTVRRRRRTRVTSAA